MQASVPSRKRLASEALATSSKIARLANDVSPTERAYVQTCVRGGASVPLETLYHALLNTVDLSATYSINGVPVLTESPLSFAERDLLWKRARGQPTEDKVCDDLREHYARHPEQMRGSYSESIPPEILALIVARAPLSGPVSRAWLEAHQDAMARARAGARDPRAAHAFAKVLALVLKRVYDDREKLPKAYHDYEHMFRIEMPDELVFYGFSNTLHRFGVSGAPPAEWNNWNEDDGAPLSLSFGSDAQLYWTMRPQNDPTDELRLAKLILGGGRVKTSNLLWFVLESVDLSIREDLVDALFRYEGLDLVSFARLLWTNPSYESFFERLASWSPDKEETKKQ